MFHANAFLVDVQQTGPRGGDKLFSANWIMPMMHRQFGRQGLTFRSMLSLEPATVTKRQYPLLFQTGETASGFSIVNGQHPHDFFKELAGRYDLVVVIRVKDNESMAQIVTEHMLKIDGINKSETLISFRVHSRFDLEQMFSIGW